VSDPRTAWASADPASLIVSIDQRAVPLLPRERILGAVPSVRAVTPADVVHAACLALCSALLFAEAVVRFAAGPGAAAGVAEAASLFLLAGLGAGVLAGGASQGSGAVPLAGGAASAVTAVLVAVTTVPLGSAVGGMVAMAASAAAAAAFLTARWDLAAAADAQSAVVLTSHRLVALGVRSPTHHHHGGFDAPDPASADPRDACGLSVVVDSWWLPLGLTAGAVSRSRAACSAEVLVGPSDVGGALRIAPGLGPRRLTASLARGMGPAALGRFDTFAALLMHSAPPDPAVDVDSLPPPPPGRLLSPADFDPSFEHGGLDGTGVAGRVRLLEGEAALAYLDSTTGRTSCGFASARALTCGVCPARSEQRFVVTDRRAYALAWQSNAPAACCWWLYRRDDVLLFGPLGPAAAGGGGALSGSSFRDKCACLRWPCQPDPSSAEASVTLWFGGVPARLLRRTSLAPAGAHITPEGYWAGCTDAPLLLHMTRVLGAVQAEAQARLEAAGAPHPPRALTEGPDRLLRLAPLQTAFPAPSGPPGARADNLCDLRVRWAADAGAGGTASSDA